MAPAAPHLKLVAQAPDALERLYTEHSDRVLRAAYRVCGNMSDAEDVLQTVFVRLARSEELDLSPNPGAYLHRAAVNAALDVVRSRTRSRSVSLEVAPVNALESGGPGPEASRAEAELRETIRKAVGRLNPRAAEMFALKYFEGYDNREIGEILGMSPTVIAVLLHRARGRVRADLQKALGDTI